MDYKSLILEISSILIVNFSFYPYSKFQLVSGTDRIPCLECIRHIDRQIHLYLIQILPQTVVYPLPYYLVQPDIVVATAVILVFAVDIEVFSLLIVGIDINVYSKDSLEVNLQFPVPD